MGLAHPTQKSRVMKRIFLIVAMAAFVVVSASAQDKVAQEPRQQDREKIEIRDLPQPIRTALESTEYAGWNVSSAYRTTQTESVDETQSMEVYVVELKSGADTQIIRFDRDGNRIDEDRRNRRDQL